MKPLSVLILPTGQSVHENFKEAVEKGSRDERLLASIAWDRLPRHVAIIMVGNSR